MKCFIGNHTYYFDRTAIEEYPDRFVMTFGFPQFVVFKDTVTEDVLKFYGIEGRAEFDAAFDLDQRQNQRRDSKEETEKIFGFIPEKVYKL